MVQHIVMWRFAEQADGHTREENLERVRTALLELPAKVPGIRAFHVHRDAGLDPGAFDLCLVSDFDDAEALKRYSVHPDHQAVSALVGRVRETRAAVDFIC